MVEEYCSYVVQMPIKSEETPAGLIRPDLNLVVVSARHEEGLRLVEVDSSNRSIMLLETVDQRSHTIVPQLYS